MENTNRLLPLNLQFFAEPAPSGDGAGEGNNPAGDDQNGGTGGESGGENKGADNSAALLAQIEQMKADMAKQKEALDKATSEAGKYRKELQAKKTQEELDADAKKEAEEKAAARLAELEKTVAMTQASKAVMSNLGVDEATAEKIAESLIGCENVDNALLLIKQAWTAKEKALKLEYGKIPSPGAGGGNEDKEMQAALELAKELGKRRAGTTQSVRDQLGGLVR